MSRRSLNSPFNIISDSTTTIFRLINRPAITLKVAAFRFLPCRFSSFCLFVHLHEVLGESSGRAGTAMSSVETNQFRLEDALTTSSRLKTHTEIGAFPSTPKRLLQSPNDACFQSAYSEFHLTPLSQIAGESFDSPFDDSPCPFESPFERSNPSLDEEYVRISRPALRRSCHSSPSKLPRALAPKPNRDRLQSTPASGVRARRWFTSPDRFVGSRSNSQTAMESFQLGLRPHELSPSERAFRKRSFSFDPFSFPRPNRETRIGDIGYMANYHMIPRHLESTRSRHGMGGVWNISAATEHFGRHSQLDSAGQHPLSRKYRNTPFYDSGLCGKITSRAETLRHQSRVALAMDVDQAAKVLRHGDADSELHAASRSSTRLPGRFNPVIWRDNCWTNIGENLGKTR